MANITTLPPPRYVVPRAQSIEFTLSVSIRGHDFVRVSIHIRTPGRVHARAGVRAPYTVSVSVSVGVSVVSVCGRVLGLVSVPLHVVVRACSSPYSCLCSGLAVMVSVSVAVRVNECVRVSVRGRVHVHIACPCL